MSNILHGDVDLILTSLPKNAKKLDNYNPHPRGHWIELGEHTGNAHVICPTRGATVNFYLDIDGTLYTEVIDAPAVITHEEHAPLIILPGIYRKVIETEYDPFKKAISRVVD